FLAITESSDLFRSVSSAFISGKIFLSILAGSRDKVCYKTFATRLRRWVGSRSVCRTPLTPSLLPQLRSHESALCPEKESQELTRPSRSAVALCHRGSEPQCHPGLAYVWQSP